MSDNKRLRRVVLDTNHLIELQASYLKKNKPDPKFVGDMFPGCSMVRWEASLESNDLIITLTSDLFSEVKEGEEIPLLEDDWQEKKVDDFPVVPVGATIPILYDKEEAQIKKLTEEQFDSIREQMAASTPKAIGYRLMIKPIPVSKSIGGVDAKKFEKLANIGFTDKTNKEASKQTHGSDVGVVVSIGNDAYSVGTLENTDNWCQINDVVIFPRYSGHRCEVPPGSGDFYHFMNDDDIVGKYEGIEI